MVMGKEFYLGQLFLGDNQDHSIPQKTPFSNSSKISAGFGHSLFQNNTGEIFACGYNADGQCGLGHFNDPQITPILIPNTPSNIVEFVCGSSHNFFLDTEGNVFSVGSNYHGQLGLGHNRNQNVLKKIPNIPPIKTISCTNASSYLIDFEGNLWSCVGSSLFHHVGPRSGCTHQPTNQNPFVDNSLLSIFEISPILGSGYT